MTSEQRGLLAYISKCILGCVLVFALASIFQFPEMGWLLISLVLVLSPDGKEALALAVARIKSNLAASAVSLLVLQLSLPAVLAIAIGFIFTLVVCYLAKIMEGSRSALAAVVIVTLHEPGSFPGRTALERSFFVVSGCLLGLLVTYIFHLKLPSAVLPEPPKSPE